MLNGTVRAFVLTASLAAASSLAALAQPIADDRLAVGAERVATLAGGEESSFVVRLNRGGSADIVVTQQGVDLVVEVRAPDGSLYMSVDSPNGRNGDELVEIFSSAGGDYRLVVRPYSTEEPQGRFVLSVRALRDRAATRALLDERRAERETAAVWLRRRAIPFAMSEMERLAQAPTFQTLANDAAVIGLGEATHGSREFGDARLALTQALVSRHGYRLIALEGSASRMRALRPWIEGGAPVVLPPAFNDWIGVRTRQALLDWVHTWNVAHPGDRIAIVGLDAGDNALSRLALSTFLQSAYGSEAAEAWRPIDRELAEADEQTLVFGDSGVSEAARSATLAQLARLFSDEALLRRRLGDALVEEAIAAVGDLAQFADFNAGGTALSHGRDWYMAANLAHAMSVRGGDAKAVLWAHNAHVVGGRPDVETTGAFLRAAFGCRYRSVALTFGAGAFLAQVPNDPEDRLAVSALPSAAEDSIDGVLRSLGAGGWFAAWACGEAPADLSDWLARDRPMRWIGGLWDPGTAPDLSTRPYTLSRDFDAILFFPRVAAERAPAGRTAIPRRRRAAE